MSITGNNNCLIGVGAALPAGVTSDAVVLGRPASTVYLGGGAVAAGPSALTLAAGVQLVAGGSPGAANQVLKSTGAGVQWASVAQPAATAFSTATVSAAYTTYVCNATSGSPALTLPAASAPASAALVGVQLSVKNKSALTLTIYASADLVLVNSQATASSTTIGSGGSCSLVSDGTNWFMLDVTGPAPAAPGPASGVAITAPAPGATPAALTVTWGAAANATSYLVTITQGGAIVGSASAPAGATSASVPPISAYNTASTTGFIASVTAYNSWLPGAAGNSGTYDFSAPTNIIITVPTPGGNSPTTIRATWTPPAFAVSSYTVILYTNTGPITISTTGVAYDFANISINNLFNFYATVSAGQTVGTSNYSQFGLPSEPTNVSVRYSNAGGGNVGWGLITFSAPSYLGASAVTSYVASITDIAGNPITTTNFSNPGTDQNVYYFNSGFQVIYVAICATNSIGNGSNTGRLRLSNFD